MKSISDILKNKVIKGDVRNKHEFQAYGNRLADDLGDVKRRALYIKLAKETDRNLLEVAREYVMRSETAETKGRLFMWKLTQLKNDLKAKASEQPKGSGISPKNDLS
jgi:hypothetical protein